MAVSVRIALDRTHDAQLGAAATVVTALIVAVVWALADPPACGLHLEKAWPFALAGMLSPGGAQLFVTLAIRETGASRTSVVLGTAPLVAVTIALVLLGEPLSAALLVGAVLVVAGAVELARERERPEHLRRIGLLYGWIAVVLFAARDNVLRWLARSSPVPPAVAAAAALVGGAALISAVALRSTPRRSLSVALPFVPAGLFFGTSYVLLFEAYFRGRVSVVSPLVATESLWGVVLSVLLLRRTELVGPRLVVGAALVVAGGALIGAVR
jgi:drug/metabolite transporter (DMT)-like permease